MSEEDLELLITLDDPVDAQEEDTFNHQDENTLEYWLGKPFPERGRHSDPAEAIIDNDPDDVKP
ncbi:MAG TPA: hypothetical protein VFH31_02950 [Pyrinomonadaceae bacterium]|nr:hypothetical protein [Pyrinomonadaceae bacterium]